MQPTRLFSISGTPDTELPELDPQAISRAYQELVHVQVSRMGVLRLVTRIDVHLVGRAADGLSAYGAMVRLAKWESRLAVRLLAGLPLLEHEVRKAAGKSWLGDATHFAGVWLRAGGETQGRLAIAELRLMLPKLEAACQPCAEELTTSGGDLHWTMHAEMKAA